VKKPGVETYERITSENSDQVDWSVFANTYEHDVVIDPEADADWTSSDGKDERWSDRLKQGKQHRLPVFVGMMNWARENDEIGYRVEQKEITRLLMEWLDVSRQTAYTYRDGLVDEGLLTPTPSTDPDRYLNRYGTDTHSEWRDVMILGMAGKKKNAAVEDDLSPMERARWPGVDECFKAVAEHLTADYYVTVGEDLKWLLWRDVKQSIEAVAENSKRKNRTYDREVTEWDKACAVAEFNTFFVTALRDEFGMEKEAVEMINVSRESSDRSVDGRGEWRDRFEDAVAEFEREAFGVGEDAESVEERTVEEMR